MVNFHSLVLLRYDQNLIKASVISLSESTSQISVTLSHNSPTPTPFLTKTITATVKDYNNVALPGVTVEIISGDLTRLKDNNGNYLSAVSDINGKITISGFPVLTKGNYLYVRITKTGKATTIYSISDQDLNQDTLIIYIATWTEVANSGVLTDYGITVDTTKAFICGQIRDSSGMNVSNSTAQIIPAVGTLSYNGGGTKTNSSGQFLINKVPLNTTYNITGYNFYPMDITIGSDPVVYMLGFNKL